MSKTLKYLTGVYFIIFGFSLYAQEKSHTVDVEKEIISIDNDTVYSPPMEHMPEFPGGLSELFYFLKRNVKYPIFKSDFDYNGRTIIKLIVEKDGSMSNPVVIKSFEPRWDEEAIRVVGLMPRWKPAMLDGKPVRCYYIIPVTFSSQY